MTTQPTTAVSASKVSWAPSPGLLVSARSLAESRLVISAGAKWLDLKEPSLGSLGRPSLELVFSILELDIAESMQISVAGGELKDWSEELDHLLSSKLPARAYLKLALADCDGTDWQIVAERISRSFVRRSQLILVHYADFRQSKSPSWFDVIETTKALGGRFILIDTHNKKMGGLFDHYSTRQLNEMISEANQRKLGVALAGSLTIDQLAMLSRSRAGWLGVRSAICTDADRTSGICPDRLRLALELFDAIPFYRS